MTTLTVGAGQAYSTIAAAVAASKDGDTVQVQAGTYVNDFATINTKITIQGVGGMVNLVATVPPPDGKAYFTTNTDVSLDHLAFSGVQVADQNGAGIRYQGGNLTVTDCYFHDNQDGILGTPGVAGTGTVTIKNSEFAHNGAGDGYSHNIYIGDVASLVIDNSYFHDAVVGHEIKSRAEQTTITNSRIQDGPSGTASYSIDLPNGGTAVIQNNTIEKGPNAQNPAIIAYGEEGNLRSNSSLTVTGNTILNDLNSGSSVAVWNAAGARANVTGNATYGLSAGQIIRGVASVPGNTTLVAEPALVTTSPWAGTPTPTVPAAVVLPTASPTDTLVLNLSEDAYLGDAQFTVTVDGKSLGAAQSVTASHGQGQSEAFTFTGSFGAGPHQVGVTFLNDLYAPGVGDRNLYVNSISLDGTVNPSTTAPLYSGGTQTFAVTSTASASVPAPVPTPTPVPAPVPTPTATDTLVLSLSEDAYLGDAQFTATVDGKSLGAAQSVTASHGQGQTQAFTFTGSFGAGPHQVGVTFLNDLYAPGVGDRNLFVNGVSLDGTANPSATAAMYSGGTQTFAVTSAAGASAPTPTPVPTPVAPITSDTLVLTLSEDAWQGDAQFVATVDGKSLGPAQSVTASQSQGHTQAFTFTGSFGAGAHDLALSFTNDAWGGTPATDRNLYVNSVSLDGTTYSSATTPLYSNGTVHFQVGVPVTH